MTSVQERLQIKREPIDKWSVREQLCLASAVARSGDQNWVSVARALKPFGDPSRPADWFSQKNCAAQYGALLGNVETPKRKKRQTGADAGVETPVEAILRKLLAERKAELAKLLAEEKAEYQKLHVDLQLLQSGKVSEEQLDKWCKEIDEEEQKREQEANAHAQWLKERETRKQEIERVWRPIKCSYAVPGQKRKNSDSLENVIDAEQEDGLSQSHSQFTPVQTPEPVKPALSPLLTSLLKSPSQIPNVSVNNSSILHTAITNQRTMSTAVTNPTISSLLNSSTNVTVSPSLQQLVSTAIGQEPVIINEHNEPLAADILDDANHLKIDDLANSILVQDGPLPEIKKEEVDDIISEIIENAQDIVDDPEQHLELDGNGDININLELDDLEEDDTEQVGVLEAQEELTKEILPELNKTSEKAAPAVPEIDPFEFHEDPIIFDPIKPATPKQDSKQYVPHYQQMQNHSQYQQHHQQFQHQLQHQQNQLQETQQEVQKQQNIEQSKTVEEKTSENLNQIPHTVNEQLVDKSLLNLEEKRGEEILESQEDPVQKDPAVKETYELSQMKSQKSSIPGSVEIVEVLEMDDEECNKELNKKEIEDIVHSTKKDSCNNESRETLIKEEQLEDVTEKLEEYEQFVNEENKSEEIRKEIDKNVPDILNVNEEKPAPAQNLDINLQEQEFTETTLKEEFDEDLYDNMNMEVKIDKTGKAKRDYSRTKKKEEKPFDVVLSMEKVPFDDGEFAEDSSYGMSDTEKKDVRSKTKSEIKPDIKSELKSENERSNSPWTEEEDVSNIHNPSRRYSAPTTPIDSIPDSPASSITYDDDRDYRNWKKSVMLVYNRLVTHKYASLFLKPITEDQAPGYNSIVYRPMDLQTIKKNIDNGTIRTTQEFKRDVMLMFTNAIMYNKTNDTVYNMAKEMQEECMNPIDILMQAQGGNVPLRRETRTSESSTKRKRPVDDSVNVKNKKRKED